MLNTTDEAILKSLAVIENIAPKAWQMLVAKQKFDALISLYNSAAWIILLTVVIIGFNKCLNLILKECEERNTTENKYFFVFYNSVFLEY